MNEFDVIVVGAGAAGCTLAARLTEDPDLHVLLLEAGPSDRTLNVRIPAAFPKLIGSARDWGFQTPPEPDLGGRRVIFPRGRTLGGSTSANAQVYTRGHAADYAAWADEAGDGWAPAALTSCFDRVERTLSVEALRTPNRLSRAFVAAARADRMPDDCAQAGEREGVGFARVMQRRGRRWSAADAYLRPALRRPNLEVRTDAEVLRLSFSGASRVDGVAYRADGETRIARARHEVVVCAGAIGSPHLLLRSGIGPGEHLQAIGIGVRHDMAGVGQNLVDHPLCPFVFACDARVSLKDAERPGQLVRYLAARRGMLSSNVAEAVAFVRTHPGLDAPDLELVFAPVAWAGQGIEPPPHHGFTIGAVALAPRSRGQVALASADPTAPPAIRPGYLGDEADVRVLAAGLDRARRLAGHPQLQAFGGVREVGPTAGAQTPAEVATALREVAQTIYHPAGTCRMGRDTQSVVDPELRVRGLAGLRVADASVMPTLVRAHPQAATHVIAERAAELIRGASPAPANRHLMEVPA